MRRQVETLTMASRAKANGITVKELRELGWHHGTASSILSILHKEGRLERLVEKRDRCHIYVTVDDVNGRPTEKQGNRIESADHKMRVIVALARGWAVERCTKDMRLFTTHGLPIQMAHCRHCAAVRILAIYDKE